MCTGDDFSCLVGPDIAISLLVRVIEIVGMSSFNDKELSSFFSETSEGNVKFGIILARGTLLRFSFLFMTAWIIFGAELISPFLFSFGTSGSIEIEKN